MLFDFKFHFFHKFSFCLKKYLFFRNAWHCKGNLFVTIFYVSFIQFHLLAFLIPSFIIDFVSIIISFLILFAWTSSFPPFLFFFFLLFADYHFSLLEFFAYYCHFSTYFHLFISLLSFFYSPLAFLSCFYASILSLAEMIDPPFLFLFILIHCLF